MTRIANHRDPGSALVRNSCALAVWWEVPLWCNLWTDESKITSVDAHQPRYKKEITRNSAIADKPRDALRGQSRTPNMVLFDMVDMVSY